MTTQYNYSLANVYEIVYDDPEKHYPDNNGIIYSRNDETFDNLFSAYFTSIIEIDNESMAKEFVDKALESMDILEILKCYYGITNKTIAKYKRSRLINNTIIQEGGIVEDDDLGPITEPHIYKMMMLMDTIHDFKDKKNCKPYLEQFILDHIDDMPYIIENGIKKDFKAELIMAEELCIEVLAKMPKLVFRDDYECDNPFYNISIWGFSLKRLFEEVPSITYSELLKRNTSRATNKSKKNKVFSIDLYGYGNLKLLTLEYNQLFRFVGTINSLLNYNNSETMSFQVDNINETFPKFFFSLSYINNEITKLFTLDTKAKDFIEYNQLVGKSTPNWSFKYSDANIYDPADITLLEKNGYDNRPTGSIYNARLSLFQVYLDGVNYIIPPNIKQPGQIKPSTNVSIIDLGHKQTFKIDNDNSDTFSPTNITMILSSENSKYPLNPKLFISNFQQYDSETLFALKRAGDWGQVEHCKKYGKIFITGDRYAALYAYWRGVPTILVRKTYAMADYRVRITDRENYPNLCQLSFIIFNPDL